MQVNRLEPALGSSMAAPWWRHVGFHASQDLCLSLIELAIYPMPAGFLHQPTLLD